MASVKAGSDEVTEMFCEPCGDDGADGYCTDCQEYLCTACVTHHRKVRLSRHHVILDKSQMPKIKPSSTTMDTCTEPCARHKGEIISFYCKSHDQLGCQRCVKIGHIGCTISKLSDVSEGIVQSLQYKELMKKLNGLEQQYGRTLSLSKKHVEEIETYHSKAKEELEKLITVFRDEDLKMMSSISETSNAVIAEIRSMTAKLEKLQRTNENSQIFVEMINATNQIQTLEDSLRKIEADNTIRTYTFTEMEQSSSVESNQKVLGQLVMLPVLQKSISPAPELLRKSVTPAHVADLDIKSSTDSEVSNITGSCLLSDNQLVIADHNNKKVKLVDLKQNKVTSEVQLTSRPWDVTMIDNSQVAVTVYGENKIQLLSTTSSSLSKGREIKTNGRCMGLVHNDGTLIVMFQSPGKVEMMDMNGSVLRSLNKDSNSALFDTPYNIAISPDKTAVYVSDCSKHTVTCMAMDGTVKAVYKDDNLKYPEGLAIDRTGAVYVCGYSSSNVHRITAECSKIQILLGQEHGVANPHSITYSDSEDRLYVGMNRHFESVCCQINPRVTLPFIDLLNLYTRGVHLLTLLFHFCN